MSFQPGAMLYTQGFGSRPENVEVPHIEARSPQPTDVLYPIGKRWIDTSAGNEYALTSFTSVAGVLSANWAFLGSSSGDLNSLTTDDLTVVTPTSGTILLKGSGSIATTGSNSPGTATIALTGLTNHNVLVGAGTSTITKVAPSATSGVALVSQGAAADPIFGTVSVAGGGTGAVTLTGVLTGNGTSPITANAVTNHGVLLGGASNAVSSLGVAATGTVLAGITGADPAFTGSPSVSGSLTAATTVTASLGAITATNGNLVLGTAGNKVVIATGANASVGVSGNMAGTPGVVVVATTASSASALIFYSRATTGGTPGEVSITAQDGTGFTLTSTGNETSTFNWWIINA